VQTPQQQEEDARIKKRDRRTRGETTGYVGAPAYFIGELDSPIARGGTIHRRAGMFPACAGTVGRLRRGGMFLARTGMIPTRGKIVPDLTLKDSCAFWEEIRRADEGV
jgi:hypothetical protein